jgi:hypothetical protein
MAKEKIKISKDLKAIGAVDAERDGGKLELTIDPSKLSGTRRKRMAEGMSKAIASTAFNAPYAPEFFEGPGNISEISEHEAMRLAMLYDKSDPLVGKIIEVMRSLAMEGFKNEDVNKARKAWFDKWCEAVGFEEVLGWIFYEWFRSGNVTTARKLVPASSLKFLPEVPEYSTDGSVAEEYDKTVAAKKIMYSKASIPGAYTVLNPLTIYVQPGDREELMFRAKNGAGSALVPLAEHMGLGVTELKVGDLEDKIKALKGVPLYKKNISRICRLKQPYEDYGRIIMERAFGALYEKNKLRQAELSMLNSSVNRILKVTIGNDEYPATQAQLNKLVHAFINTGKSQTIFWNHTLKIELIEPEFEPFKKSRYERVDEDIRNAFGISEILTGSGAAKANFATGFISLKVFITNMKDARQEVKRWIREQYKDIAEAMGFDGYPEPSFSEMALTDEIGEKQILMQLVDRGIISYETAQAALGYDPHIEVKRRTREKPLMEDGVLGFMGSPYNTKLQEEAVDTPKESAKNIKRENNNDPDSSDEKGQQIDQRYKKTVKNPSQPVADKMGPKKGDEGRPTTPRGKSMPRRKSASSLE